MPEHTPAPTPHRAVYGFAFYLLFLTLSVVYVLWVLLPTDKLGLNYLPDKYFAVLLPMLVLVGLSFFIFFIYPAINFAMTPRVDELASVVDVSLVGRHGQLAGGVNSWAQLRCGGGEESGEPTHTRQVVENCKICKETHIPSTTKPIAALRFIDLDEMNRNLFEGGHKAYK